MNWSKLKTNLEFMRIFGNYRNILLILLKSMKALTFYNHKTMKICSEIWIIKKYFKIKKIKFKLNKEEIQL